MNMMVWMNYRGKTCGIRCIIEESCGEVLAEELGIFYVVSDGVLVMTK